MINITKIYLVTNIDNDPFKVYIGKTKNSRKNNHQQIYGKNISYTYIDEINSLDYKDWEPLETYWIEQFKAWGFEVVNIRKKGGSGSEFWTNKQKNNQERKNKLRKANKGKPKPQGFGEQISKIKLAQNIKFTQDHKAKITQGKLGKKQPQSFLDKKYKSIIQLDKENNQLNEFKSIEEAANSNEIFKRSNISCCLTNKSKTAYGYKWFYKLTNKI